MLTEEKRADLIKRIDPAASPGFWQTIKRELTEAGKLEERAKELFSSATEEVMASMTPEEWKSFQGLILDQAKQAAFKKQWAVEQAKRVMDALEEARPFLPVSLQKEMYILRSGGDSESLARLCWNVKVALEAAGRSGLVKESVEESNEKCRKALAAWESKEGKLAQAPGQVETVNPPTSADTWQRVMEFCTGLAGERIKNIVKAIDTAPNTDACLARLEELGINLRSFTAEKIACLIGRDSSTVRKTDWWQKHKKG